MIKLEFLKMYRSTSEKFYIALKTSASFWHLQLNLYPIIPFYGWV